MAVFEYSALDTKGKTKTGIIDADSAISARQKLRASEIYPVSIKEVQDSPSIKGTKFISKPGFLSRVKLSEISMMTRQLSTLLGAGFPLVSAIDTLIFQTKSQIFQKTLARIKESIVEGSSFAKALQPYTSVFSPLYVNMVHAGESSGTLEIVLSRLADIIEKQQELKNKIKAALAYPIAMSIIGTVILFILLTYIVPNITAVFIEQNEVLPAPTRLLIGISEIFQFYWWLILAGIIMLVLIFYKTKKTEKGRHFIHRAVLAFPLVGMLVTKLSIARFSRTLGSLHENGVAMLTALDIGKNIINNVLISDAVDEAAKEVSKGQGLGKSLEKSGLFPHLFTQMVQVGEQSGELETMLEKIADVFDNESEATIMGMTSLLEPIMILIMGGVVLFIVTAICFPIFEMSQLIK